MLTHHLVNCLCGSWNCYFLYYKHTNVGGAKRYISFKCLYLLITNLIKYTQQTPKIYSILSIYTVVFGKNDFKSRNHAWKGRAKSCSLALPWNYRIDFASTVNIPVVRLQIKSVESHFSSIPITDHWQNPQILLANNGLQKSHENVLEAPVSPPPIIPLLSCT